VAHKTGALATRDLERAVVDTTVQPKAIAHPTDARLCHRALEKLVDLAKRNNVPLRQSYRRLAKRAAIMVGRYTHAHQFKRARRELKFLRTRLGRVIRDIRRKIAGNPRLSERFADLLALAVRVRFQDHRQRGPKVYALHAPEVECIGKGKARAPYEFGCKVSIATPATKPKGGQFVLHAKHCTATRLTATLGPVITELESLTGVETRRIHVDRGYRGHNHRHKFRVWITGQVRRVTRPIRREMKRRAAGRAGRRPSQSRAPHGPQSPQRPQRRSCQRRAGRRRLQLRPPVALAEAGFCVPSSRRSSLRQFAADTPKYCRLIVLHGRLAIRRYKRRSSSTRRTISPTCSPASPIIQPAKSPICCLALETRRAQPRGRVTRRLHQAVTKCPPNHQTGSIQILLQRTPLVAVHDTSTLAQRCRRGRPSHGLRLT
jgi:IS5 family transposase